MSGGSMNYIYVKIQNELCDNMLDDELNELMKDIAELAHDREWYESDDYGREQYFETVIAFKEKWFNGNREERLKEYIDNNLKRMKEDLYHIIGCRIVKEVKHNARANDNL